MKVSNRTIIISVTIISVLVVSLLGFVAVVFLNTPNILDVTSENNTYQSQISKYNSSRTDDTVTVFDSVSSSTNSNKRKNNNIVTLVTKQGFLITGYPHLHKSNGYG